jgi:hypothetical protein
MMDLFNYWLNMMMAVPAQDRWKLEDLLCESFPLPETMTEHVLTLSA